METGAVTGVHRAGASLHVHVHFHLLCLDGVYVDDGERRSEGPAPAPTGAELTSMLQRIYARVMRWLSRRGLLRDPDDAHDSNAPREVSPAEALATAGMQRGNLVTVRERDDGADKDEPGLSPQTTPRATDAVTYRLCRYLNRPAFSLARLRVRRDRNVSYRVKKATRGRVTQRVMTPIEALARLAELVPPPRYPLLRFHGVVAPRHRWRDRVVPRPPGRAPLCKGGGKRKAGEEHDDAEAAAGVTPTPPTPRALEAGDGRAAFVLDASTSTFASACAAAEDSPYAPSSPPRTPSPRCSPRSDAHAPRTRLPEPRRQTARHVAPWRCPVSRTPPTAAFPASLELRPPTDPAPPPRHALLRRLAYDALLSSGDRDG